MARARRRVRPRSLSTPRARATRASAPLLRSDGSSIPTTLYAAAAPRAAIAEILLHDAHTPSTGWLYDWDRDRLTDRKMSQLELPELLLARLTTFGLKAAGLAVEDLFGCDAADYPRTRVWAQWIYDNMPDVQGLYWMSRRDNEHSCVMLFGDRIDPASLAAAGSWPIEQFEDAVFDVLELLGAGLA